MLTRSICPTRRCLRILHFVFGASDAPLKGAELDKFGLVQFPMVRAVVPVVNIEGIKPGELVLDGPTRAQICPVLWVQERIHGLFRITR